MARQSPIGPAQQQQPLATNGYTFIFDICLVKMKTKTLNLGELQRSNWLRHRADWPVRRHNANACAKTSTDIGVGGGVWGGCEFLFYCYYLLLVLKIYVYWFSLWGVVVGCGGGGGWW